MIKKIWLISDTHCNHKQLRVPEVDLVIHAGDSTNSKGFMNYDQASDFFEWYHNLPIKDKLLIAGNHDYSLYNKVFNLVQYSFKYLEQDIYKYYKNQIYGTPYTPEFSDWYFMLSKEKEEAHAKNIPPCDILITHGPPKFILDSVYRENIFYEHCGDLSLYHRVIKIKPKLHVFGHIHSSHNNKYPENNGVFFNGDTWFVNASCCVDGNMTNIYTHGFICEYDIETKEVLKIYRNK
jgi:Icc-related predicted phosphoesterase